MQEYADHLQSVLFTCRFLLIQKLTGIFSKESANNIIPGAFYALTLIFKITLTAKKEITMLKSSF